MASELQPFIYLDEKCNFLDGFKWMVCSGKHIPSCPTTKATLSNETRYKHFHKAHSMHSCCSVIEPINRIILPRCTKRAGMWKGSGETRLACNQIRFLFLHITIIFLICCCCVQACGISRILPGHKLHSILFILAR